MNKHSPRITIMPDFGGAYGWLNRDGTALLGEDLVDFIGETPGISRALHTRFVHWQRTFEAAPWSRTEGGLLQLDWPEFHAQGRALAHELKQEVGEACEVIYKKPIEDPNAHLDGYCKILADGSEPDKRPKAEK